MVQRSPDIASLVVAGKKVKAELEDVVTSMERTYALGQVGELSATFAGDKIVGHPLARTGTAVQYGNGRFEVGAIEPDYGPPTVITIRCRSTLARSLRKTFKTSAERKVSPGVWIGRRVRSHGGKATVQPSAKRGVITQAGAGQSQSELDVINSLASGASWVWTERNGHLYVGQRWWFWKGNGGLPTWDVTWRKDPATDALTLSGKLSDDDLENAGTATITLPWAAGIRCAPLQRIRLRGAGLLNGMWLIESTTATLDRVSPVTVQLTQPRRPRKKKGST